MPGKRRKGRALTWLALRGLRKGLLGGSGFWLVAGGLAAALKLIRRLSGSGPEVVYQEELGPGQSVVISNGPNPR